MRFVLIVVGVASLPASAQFLEPEARALYSLTGEAAGDGFGWAVSELPDIDDDGYPDFIVGANGNAQGGAGAGAAYVFSGAGGAPIWSFHGVAGEQLGYSIADAGDIDDDGVNDIIVGGPGTQNGIGGQAHIYSGATGLPIRVHQAEALGDFFGAAVAGVGDVDGDGRDDVLIGATRHDATGNNAGRAYVLSGVDGSPIHVLDGEDMSDFFGAGTAGVGDLNTDGHADFAVGAHRAGTPVTGKVYVYSGATGTLLFPPLAPATGGTFGQFFVGPAGDANDDGTGDVYVGDYGVAGTGRAYVFSGVDGALLWVFSGQNGDGVGCGRFAGDVNGDGHDDIASGAYSSRAGGAGAGKVYILSGCDGSILRTITNTTPGEQFGFDAIGFGDVSGDGLIDFLVGASSGNKVYVVAGLPSPDLDSSGSLNVFDFLAFQNAFGAEDLRADFNLDGMLNVFDFLAFQTAFSGGCG